MSRHIENPVASVNCCRLKLFAFEVAFEAAVPLPSDPPLSRQRRSRRLLLRLAWIFLGLQHNHLYTTSEAAASALDSSSTFRVVLHALKDWEECSASDVSRVPHSKAPEGTHQECKIWRYLALDFLANVTEWLQLLPTPLSIDEDEVLTQLHSMKVAWEADASVSSLEVEVLRHIITDWDSSGESQATEDSALTPEPNDTLFEGRLKRIISEEAVAFGQWLGEEKALSPAVSVRSRGRRPSSFSILHGSPTDSKISIHSAPRSIEGRSGHVEHESSRTSRDFNVERTVATPHMPPDDEAIPHTTKPDPGNTGSTLQTRSQMDHNGVLDTSQTPTANSIRHRSSTSTEAPEWETSGLPVPYMPNLDFGRVHEPTPRPALPLSRRNPDLFRHPTAFVRYPTPGLEAIVPPSSPPPNLRDGEDALIHTLIGRSANAQDSPAAPSHFGRAGHRRKTNDSLSELDPNPANLLRPVRPTRTARPLSLTPSMESQKKYSLRSIFPRNPKQHPQPLPSDLRSTFSLCGTYVVFRSMKEHPQAVVRITQGFNSGRRIELAPHSQVRDRRMKEPGKGEHTITRTIRDVTCCSGKILALVQVDKTIWVYSTQDDGTCLDGLFEVRDLKGWLETFAVSPNGRLVALGFRHGLRVYRLQVESGHVVNRDYDEAFSSSHLDIMNREIRAHKLSFSADSKRLVSSFQVFDGKPEDQAYTVVYDCTERLKPISISQPVKFYMVSLFAVLVALANFE
ncbi:hypothetical protein M011DRAFT_268113 [Sporormia fimetaria CBS 119925]|uniref:Uncharacterized protein n=1 Tax=Sporormia fimetaria CBS 119925 TaxID=1340428 RepID=A0A6A6UYB2_9PLEO|nr:hypothetical protein M011DRAFT_268113 [Sporormia fimetaria CBS 119925]